MDGGRAGDSLPLSHCYSHRPGMTVAFFFVHPGEYAGGNGKWVVIRTAAMPHTRQTSRRAS